MNKVDLGSVQETLLLPLWGRAMETRKSRPLLVDQPALTIVESIDYDFATMAANVHPLSHQAWIARTIYFDTRIRHFLQDHPDGTVVNVGCGLDTTCDRVDNGRARWFELDFPDVIELRRRFFREGERRVFIAESALGESWYARVGSPAHVLLLFAGVIYYFTESEVRKLFAEVTRRFAGITLLFDYCSPKGLEIANRKVLRQGGMSAAARLVWAIDDIRELERWGLGLRVTENMPMFRYHKKSFPPWRRIGMNITDWMKIMSLAQVERGDPETRN